MASTQVLITRQNHDSVRINHDALREILIRPEIGNRPIAIISIVGRLRTGKSFLLNFILRYLKEKGWKNEDWMGDETTVAKEIPWKHGSKPDTLGIQIWREVFYVPQNKGEDMAVLIMDTQGLFDHATPEDVNKSLLTLSTLASSVQIFNTQTVLDTQQLAYLKTCVDYAMEAGKEKGPLFKLQSLNFLVRDHRKSRDLPYGKQSGEKYMKGIMNAETGDDKQLDIRKNIRDNFEELSCFLLPHPGLEAMEEAFEGKNAELQPAFKHHVKDYVEFIAFPLKLQPKQTEGKKMTGRDILNMITACDSLFALQVYEPQSLIEANIKSYYASEYEEAVMEYDSVMKILPTTAYLEDEVLMDHHVDAKKNALERFGHSKNMGGGEWKEHYRRHLDKVCDSHFDPVQRKNNAQKRLRDRKRQRKTREAFAEYEKEMQLFVSDDQVEPAKLVEHHKNVFEKIRVQYKQKILLEEFESDANDYLNSLRMLNKHRIERNQVSQEEDRGRSLYWSVERLGMKCEAKWTRNHTSYQTLENMKKIGKDIKKKIEKEYLDAAFTKVEKKYFGILMHSLEKEYERALQASRKKTLSDTSIDEQIQKKAVVKGNLLSEEQRCCDIVNKIVFDYARELQANLDEKITPQQMRDDDEDNHRQKIIEYIQMCSKALYEYFLKIGEIIKKEKKEAYIRNKENEISYFMGNFDLVIFRERNLEFGL